ncbi:MAG: response regulator [Alphaproteobacteria bacterium]|nr:response regulator [Alphaproteobacteria bacterium]
MIGSAERKPQRILLVEDGTTNAKLFSAMLDRLGYDCHVCSTGQAALDILKTEKFDITLLDIRLPDISGVKVARLIREELKIGNAAMPIIALTAYTAPQDVTTYLEAGMDDYLPKPLPIADLERALQEWSGETPENFDSFVWGFEYSYDNPPDLDVEALQNFIGFMGKDKIKDMYRQFREDYVQRQGELRASGHDCESVHHLLHPLIAVSASMGLMKLSGYCRNIIDQCQDRSYTPPANLAEEIQTFYDAGTAALSTYIKTL